MSRSPLKTSRSARRGTQTSFTISVEAVAVDDRRRSCINESSPKDPPGSTAATSVPSTLNRTAPLATKHIWSE